MEPKNRLSEKENTDHVEQLHKLNRICKRHSHIELIHKLCIVIYYIKNKCRTFKKT